MPEVMKTLNAKLEKGSFMNTDELEDIIALIYDGWEELHDGFQLPDLFSLAGTIGKAYAGNKVAFAQALDLQDDEIAALVDLSDGYELGDQARNARQVVKCILVVTQTYDKLIHESKSPIVEE
jgi:hypothetical protein